MDTRTIVAYLLIAVMALGIATLVAVVRRRRKRARRGRRSWW